MAETVACDQVDAYVGSGGAVLEQFVDMMTKAPEAITVLDPNAPGAPIIFANQRFLRLTRYKAAEVTGRNFGFLRGIRNDRQSVDRRWRRNREFSACLPTHRGDGSTFFNYLNVYFVGLPDGATVAVACHIPFSGRQASKLTSPPETKAWIVAPPEVKAASRAAAEPPVALRMRARATEMFVDACAQVVMVENAKNSVAETRRLIEERRIFQDKDRAGELV